MRKWYVRWWYQWLCWARGGTHAWLYEDGMYRFCRECYRSEFERTPDFWERM